VAIPGRQVAVIVKADGFSLLPMRAIRNIARVAKARRDCMAYSLLAKVQNETLRSDKANDVHRMK
jgi:hypothetical protein